MVTATSPFAERRTLLPSTSAQTAVDIVMMAFVPTLATVSLGQFDAVLFDPVDGADMDAVRANYFHMLLNAAHNGHS